jgi:hypothetical protein
VNVGGEWPEGTETWEARNWHLWGSGTTYQAVVVWGSVPSGT